MNNDLYHLQDNKNSCLNLVNNNVDYYCSWMPYGNQSIRDTEIGINSSVAEAIGTLILKISQQRRKFHTRGLKYFLNEIFHQKYYSV